MIDESLWGELEGAGGDGEGSVVRRIHPESAVDLYLAVTKPANRRMLLLSVAPFAAEDLEELPTGRGVETRLHHDAPRGRAQLELVLMDTSSADIFAALVEDLAAAVAPADDDRAAVAAWTGRLRRWQRLLASLTPEGLSGERQRGLYAELWLLRHHLLELAGAEDAIRAWTGPDAASHDFEFHGAAIEVKSTAGKQHQVLRIASERQLDDTGVAALFLFHLSLDVRHGEGETLVDAVAAVRSALAATPAATLLEERLLASGYASAHEARYRRTAYTVRELNFFHVREDFPRLTEADLPAGVGDVRYSVGVAEARHWSVDIDRVAEAIVGAGMSDELDVFAENLRQDVLVTAEAEGDEALRSEVFTRLTIETLEEAGEVEEGMACYHRDRGLEVSGYGVEEEDTLNLFATVHTGEVPARSVTRTEVDTAFRRLLRFWERCRDTDYHLELEESSDQFDMVLRIRTMADRIERIRMFLLTDGVSRVEYRPDEEHLAASTAYAVWDLQRLHRCLTSGQRREPIEIDFVERFGAPIPCLTAQEPGADYAAYLAIFPAEVLGELYAQYGPRLLELNVRSFLQARGKVNRGIRDTIVGEPERFLAYNNGISATASSIELTNGTDGVGIGRIADLQIVNGGQTTASIHHAVRRDRADVSRVFVQAKITVVPEARLGEIVPLISRFANSQNRISEADLSANDPFHVAIEELSRTVWAPATDGTQRQTRWFYERARGQYADALGREGTPARQRAFKQQNPTPQKFGKTDLAKFENTWDQLPHEVSRGAQKSFVIFMHRLQARGGVKPDVDYFQNLTAKALLFRRAERLVSAQDFGGYRANIVTYTLALLSNRTAQRIDLGRIWERQDLAPPLEDAIVDLSHRVHAVITDPPGAANVTEYCKREACWTRVKELDVTLPEQLAAELMTMGSGRRRRRSGIDTVQPEERAVIDQIAGVRGELWFALAQWAKETDSLQPWQRSLSYSLGRLANQAREPSRKQAVQAKLILEEADRLGFSGEAAA